MYSFLKTAAAAATGWVVLAGNAFANVNQGCGTIPGAPACQVPEPGTWALVAIAVAGVAVVSKFGKKK